MRSPLAAGRLAGGMRGDDHVPLPEGMSGREPFRIGHVQAGRGDLALVQRSDERLGVDDTPLRETSTRIVPCFIIRISSADHFLDTGVSGTVLATTSARGKRRWNASGLRSSRRDLLAHLRVGGQHLHPEAEGPALDLAADAAQSDDQQRFLEVLKTISGGFFHVPSGGASGMKCVRRRVNASR